MSAELFFMNPGHPGLGGRSSPALNSAMFSVKTTVEIRGFVFTIIVWPAAAKV